MCELRSKEIKIFSVLLLCQHDRIRVQNKSNLVRLRPTIHAHGESEPESGSTSEFGCYANSTPEQFGELT